jgi:MSHA biogenesis protein MshP
MSAMLHRTRGFGLMLAIFLLVTIASVGVYLVTVSSGQVQAVAQDELGVRAYQAARTGIDWGAYRVLINSSCVASTTLTLPQSGLTGVTFYAVVGCSTVGTEAEAGTTITVYQLTSTGCSQTPCAAAGTDPGPTYVERQLSLTLTR